MTYIRYSGQHLCADHFVRFFETRAKLELSEQGRLPEGLTAVALSGGKDSVACLHLLSKVAAKNPKLELAAISIDEGIAGYRGSALDICKEVTTQLDVPWHTTSIKDLAGYDIDAYASGAAGPDADGAERPACGPCGVYRRLGMNQLAKEIGADAVATGHNLDDMAQSILMNVLNGDAERLGRLAPHKSGQEGMVRRILPFRTIPEKEVLLYAILEDLPLHHEAECPYAARANRFALRDQLLEMEARQPGTRHRLVAFHDKVKPLLEAAEERPTLQACPQCEEPTSGDLCKACVLR